MNNPLHIELLSKLVSFKSVTPDGADAISYCFDFLQKLGFSCQELKFGNVTNLYAKFGDFEKNLCFAGHVDVVPAFGRWDTPPFVLTEKNNLLYGRGTNDMKGPLSACFAAIHDFITLSPTYFSLSVILTSDEEIMEGNGTKKVIDFLKSKGEKISACIVCESCSPRNAGEYIKIGCRGSLNVDLISIGPQCHVINGKTYGNHLHGFVEFLSYLSKIQLDEGGGDFPASDFELTSIDVGNNVRNIIPEKAIAKLNIRFNDLWNFEKLEKLISRKLPNNVNASFERFGCPFIGSKEKFIEFLSKSITKSIGISPKIGTLGGSSDALFIKELTNVVEIGSSISNAHISNEFISKDDMLKLRKIYFSIMNDFEEWNEM
ncbi:MAG: succinyl-diaminopimelate desuccinylase [Holosporales bacterium]|jgi:succinyl-diaminopimelate desuccinylase|nr:succinyl-diaminopimelate desuccinylase [Holosporales bacterium]